MYLYLLFLKWLFYIKFPAVLTILICVANQIYIIFFCYIMFYDVSVQAYWTKIKEQVNL